MAQKTRSLKLLLELAVKGSYKAVASDLKEVRTAADGTRQALEKVASGAGASKVSGEFRQLAAAVKSAEQSAGVFEKNLAAVARSEIAVAKATGDYGRALSLVKGEMALAGQGTIRYNQLLIEQTRLQAAAAREAEKTAQAQARAAQQVNAQAVSQRDTRRAGNFENLPTENKGAVDGLVGSLKSLAGAYIGVQGAQALVDWTRQGAAIQGVTDSFERLAVSSGRTSQTMLGELRAASQGMISDAQLMEGANKAMLLGGERLASALPKLLQIAQASAKATGQDVQFVFDSLVTGLARSSKQIIDNAGITVDVAAANQIYADSIGKTVLQLNDQEKALAFQNAVMAQGSVFVEKLGTDTQNASAKVAQASATWNNFFNTLKVGAAVAFVGLTDALSLSATALSGFEGGMAQINTTALTAGTSFEKYSSVLAQAGEGAAGLSQAQYQAAAAMVANGTSATQAAAAVMGLEQVTAQIEGGFFKQASAAYASAEAQAALGQRAVELAAVMSDGGVAVQALAEQFALEQITAEELAAALTMLYEQQLYAAEGAWANSEASAVATESAASLTASIYQLSDAQIDNISQTLTQQTETQYLEQFQYDLAAAADASQSSTMGAAWAAAQLSIQYGRQLPEINALIAALNQYNAALAGKMGAQVGAAVARNVKSDISLIKAGHGELVYAGTPESRARKSGGGSGRKAAAGSGKAKTGGSKAKSGTGRDVDPAKAAADAAKQAGETAESLAKLRGFVAPAQADIDAYTSSMAALTASYGEKSKTIAQHLNEGTAEFITLSGKAVSTLKEGVAGFNAVRGYVSVPKENLSAFTGDMAEITRQFGERSKEVNLDLAANTMLFAETAAKSVSTIKEGVEGFAALKGYSGTAQIEIALFSLAMRDTYREFSERTKEVDMTLAEATNTFSESASKAIGTVAVGVAAFKELEGFAPVPRIGIQLFSLALRDAYREFSERTKEIDMGLAEASNTFSDSAKKMIEVIAVGIEAFTKLEKYAGTPQIKLAMIAQDILTTAQMMTAMAAQFDLEAVAAAAAFSESVNKILAPISTAVDAFTKLADYKGVAPAAMAQVHADMRLAINYTMQTSAMLDAEGVTAAATFATSANTVFGAISAGADALGAIREYQSVAPEAFGAFAGDFMTAVAMTSQLAGASGQMLSQSNVWRSNIDSAVANIRGGIDAIASLNGLSVNVSASVSASGSSGGGSASSDGGGAIAGGGGAFAPGRALGGRVDAGQAYTVGERGRELFVPDRGGRIVPNSQLGKGGRGDVIVNVPPGAVVVSGGTNTAQTMALVNEALDRFGRKLRDEILAERRARGK